MVNRICKYCGKEISNERYCPYCGYENKFDKIHFSGITGVIQNHQVLFSIYFWILFFTLPNVSLHTAIVLMIAAIPTLFMSFCYIRVRPVYGTIMAILLVFVCIGIFM